MIDFLFSKVRGKFSEAVTFSGIVSIIVLSALAGLIFMFAAVYMWLETFWAPHLAAAATAGIVWLSCLPPVILLYIKSTSRSVSSHSAVFPQSKFEGVNQSDIDLLIYAVISPFAGEISRYAREKPQQAMLFAVLLGIGAGLAGQRRRP